MVRPTWAVGEPAADSFDQCGTPNRDCTPKGTSPYNNNNTPHGETIRGGALDAGPDLPGLGNRPPPRRQ